MLSLDKSDRLFVLEEKSFSVIAFVLRYIVTKINLYLLNITEPFINCQRLKAISV